MPESVTSWTPGLFLSFLRRIQKRCHRALIKYRDARAGERHELVGHQIYEQVRHRAVQALEGEPGKVARAGADTTPAMKLWRR